MPAERGATAAPPLSCPVPRWAQAMREEFWDTQPHYGGHRGAAARRAAPMLSRGAVLCGRGGARGPQAQAASGGGAKSVCPPPLPPLYRLARRDLGRAQGVLRGGPGHGAAHCGERWRHSHNRRHERLLRRARWARGRGGGRSVGQAVGRAGGQAARRPAAPLLSLKLSAAHGALWTQSWLSQACASARYLRPAVIQGPRGLPLEPGCAAGLFARSHRPFGTGSKLAAPAPAGTHPCRVQVRAAAVCAERAHKPHPGAAHL